MGQIFHMLEEMRVQVDIIDLAGNKCAGFAVERIVTFLWNHQLPALHLNLEENELGVKELIALVRLVYNHRRYPLVQQDSGLIIPFRLDVAGNHFSKEDDEEFDGDANRELEDAVGTIITQVGGEKTQFFYDVDLGRNAFSQKAISQGMFFTGDFELKTRPP